MVWRCGEEGCGEGPGNGGGVIEGCGVQYRTLNILNDVNVSGEWRMKSRGRSK